MRRTTIAIALAAALSAAPALAAEEAEVRCVELTADMAIGATDSSTGGQVSALQAFLRDAGKLDAEPTGFFGLLTKDALISFQESNDIGPANGAVGSVTRDVIRRQSCSRSAGTTGSTATVRVGTVSFDLTPVPDRTRSAVTTGSSGPTSKVKVVMKASIEETADGEGTLTASVAPRSTNDQIEVWELEVQCVKGVTVTSGQANLCGQKIGKYAYALAEPDRGFTLLTAAVENSLEKRNTVKLFLKAYDAEGNLVAKASKRLRISALPESGE